MQSFDFKKLRIHLLIIVGFALVSLLFCYPQLQGKKLVQSDNINWQGMAHEATAYHDSTSKDVLWSNSMFGGMPSYTSYVGGNTNNYISYFQSILMAVGKPAYFFFIAMLGFYILANVFSINKWLSAIGAVAYAFSSYNAIIIMVGHETKMLALGYLPAALAGLYMIYKEEWITGAAVFGIAMALLFTTNHFQIVYYGLIIFACFAVGMFFIALKLGRVKQFFISSVIAAIVGLISVGPNITAVLTTNEYVKHTMRGGQSELSGHDVGKKSGGLDKDYAFLWSSGISETITLMIPYFYGGATYEPAEMAPKTAEAVNGSAEMLPIYWGDQPTQLGPVYLGAAICFLFVLGLIVVRSPHKWWILAACIIGIVLAWGKNLPSVNYFLFDHIPYLNKFRTVEMALIIPELLFPLLGIIAVQQIITATDNTITPAVPKETKAKAAIPVKEVNRSWNDIRLAGIITIGLCILLGVAGSLFFNYSGKADAQMQPELVKLLKDDRASLAMNSALKSAAFILVAAGLLWAFITKKIKENILLAGLVIVIAVDLIPIAHSYLKDSNYADASDYESAFIPRDVDKAIMRDPDPYYRVLDLSKDPYNDATQAYFHKCVGGYSPAKMEVYQDLIERQMSKGFNGQVLNMLNTKYIIAGGQKSPAQVIPNAKACGNAWFVDNIKWVNTADEEMNGLNAASIGDTSAPKTGAFEPLQTAVIRNNFKDQIGTYTFGRDSAAYVKLAKYGLDDISFTSKNSRDGLAVFSDIYYSDGWKAFVDGKETPIVKADYVLRAIKIPAGSHNIEFHFHPDSFYKGKTIAMVSSILLIGLCLAALYSVYKRKESIVN